MDDRVEPFDLRIDPEAAAPGLERELHPAAIALPPGGVVAEGAAGQSLPGQVPAHEAVHGDAILAHAEPRPVPEQSTHAVDGEERCECAEHPGGGTARRRQPQRAEGEEQAEPGIEIVEQDRARRVAVAAFAGLRRPGALRCALGQGLVHGRAHPALPSRSRRMRTPAASRSQLSAVMPSVRSLCFSIFSVGVLGRASTMRT